MRSGRNGGQNGGDLGEADGRLLRIVRQRITAAMAAVFLAILKSGYPCQTMVDAGAIHATQYRKLEHIPLDPQP